MKKVILGALAVVLAACGSTSRMARQQTSPDSAHSPLIESTAGTSGGDVMELLRDGSMFDDDKRTSSHASRQGDAKPVASSRLTATLDELLLSVDTLLERSQLGLHIVDLTTAEVLYAHNAHQRMRPASTEKVATAVTALDLLGPGYALTTQILTTASQTGSVLTGDIYIKGVMDPLLTAADVRSLANQLRAAGIRTINGRLIVDASFKDSDEFGWGWCWDDDNPTLSPMLCGGKPVLVDQLMAAFRAVGISVGRGTSVGTAPAAATPLATVARPLTAVLQPMMKESDNLCAEAVFYHVAKAYGAFSSIKESTKSYSRKNGAAAVSAVINKSHLPTWGGREGISTVADGSGLSLYNYQTPAAFTCLLAYATTQPERILNPLMAVLPVASVDGTLKNRMAGTPAAQNVRAKTGSVSAVSTLVGYTTQRSTGHLIAFAIMNQGVRSMAEARDFQDRVCRLISE